MEALPANYESALQAAAKGLRASLEQFDKAASEVVAATVGDSEDTVSISSEARQLAAGVKEHEPDLLRGLRDMRLAKYAVMSNTRIYKTIDELYDELLDLAG